MTTLAPSAHLATRLGAALLTLALTFALVAGYKAALADTEQAVQATLARSARPV
jgi:hypothetical protein